MYEPCLPPLRRQACTEDEIADCKSQQLGDHLSTKSSCLLMSCEMTKWCTTTTNNIREPCSKVALKAAAWVIVLRRFLCWGGSRAEKVLEAGPYPSFQMKTSVSQLTARRIIRSSSSEKQNLEDLSSNTTFFGERDQPPTRIVVRTKIRIFREKRWKIKGVVKIS